MSKSHYCNRYGPPELDRITWKIVEELQHNARISGRSWVGASD